MNRFSRIAGNYVSSEVHRGSPTLYRLQALISEPWPVDVCDVGCGAGHAGLSFSSRLNSLTTIDPAAEMLECTYRLAVESSIEPIQIQSMAERLPLADNTFDISISRLAPHHFTDIRLALREMVRIVKPSGKVVIIDLEGHDDSVVDDINHKLETLHDPSHVRSYSLERWKEFMQEAGLQILVAEGGYCERPERISLERWCEIAETENENREQIRRILDQSDDEVLEALAIKRVRDGYALGIRTFIMIGQK